MAKARNTRFLNHHGYGEINLSRYLVLYLVFIGWFVLGVFLYWGAFWPSTCTPESALEIYTCSMRLPESGGWREAALLAEAEMATRLEAKLLDGLTAETTAP